MPFPDCKCDAFLAKPVMLVVNRMNIGVGMSHDAMRSSRGIPSLDKPEITVRRKSCGVGLSALSRATTAASGHCR